MHEYLSERMLVEAEKEKYCISNALLRYLLDIILQAKESTHIRHNGDVSLRT